MVNTPDLGPSQQLRLNTLIRLRWLAVVGQSITVVIVAYGLGMLFSLKTHPGTFASVEEGGDESHDASKRWSMPTASAR